VTETEIQGILHRIVERITERFRPEKIILFGSYARGTPTADSDADLLIVMNVPGSKRRASVEIDLLLVGIPIPTDIIVVTPEDVERYRDCVENVIRDAIREVKVHYENAARHHCEVSPARRTGRLDSLRAEPIGWGYET